MQVVHPTKDRESTPECGKAWARAVRLAAKELGLAPHQLSAITCTLLQKVVAELCESKQVRIPGFCTVFAVADQPRRRGDGEVRVGTRTQFVASRALRYEVSSLVPPDKGMKRVVKRATSKAGWRPPKTAVRGATISLEAHKKRTLRLAGKESVEPHLFATG
jgi:nucleoid DNA-binding protein